MIAAQDNYQKSFERSFQTIERRMEVMQLAGKDVSNDVSFPVSGFASFSQ